MARLIAGTVFGALALAVLGPAQALPPHGEIEAVPSATAAPPTESPTESLADRFSLGPEGLPKVISDTDAKLYREIFRLQERGKWMPPTS